MNTRERRKTPPPPDCLHRRNDDSSNNMVIIYLAYLCAHVNNTIAVYLPITQAQP